MQSCKSCGQQLLGFLGRAPAELAPSSLFVVVFSWLFPALLSPFPLNSDSSSSVDRFLQNIVLFIPPLASEAPPPPTTPLDSCSVSENSISNIPSSMDWRQNLNCSQVWINPQRMVLILAKESMICERVMDFCVCFILAKQVSAKMNVPAM